MGTGPSRSVREAEDDGRPRGELLLRVTGLVKRFGAQTALDHVALDVHAGEVVAVLGHNGSGKSTLVKVLAGVHLPDAGSVERPAGAAHGRLDPAGLHFIHQDLALVPDLTAVENLFLRRADGTVTAGGDGRDGRGGRRGPADTLRARAAGLAPHRTAEQHARAAGLVASFGEPFALDVPVRELTPAQRAIVAIARALDGWTGTRHVIVLDEPTESLHRSEADVLLAAVRRLAASGAGVVYISHRLDEVRALADRMVVLRDGRKVADAPAGDLGHDRLVDLITGVRADGGPPGAGPAGLPAGADRVPPPARAGTSVPALSVRGLRGRVVGHLDLDLRPGQVTGIAGVLGSGREEVPALLYGARPASAARFEVAGAPYARRSPAASLRRGMAFVPSDRKRYGAVGAFSARENLTLPWLRNLTGPFGRLHLGREAAEARALMTSHQVRPADPSRPFRLFSGGNQQKIVLAARLRTEPAVLLLDEPTQGVDIGATATVHATIERAAVEGAAVLVASSDAKELLRLCHRVLVLRDGVVAAELSGADLTEHRLVTEGYGLAEPE